jgi:hypothetical protein
VQRHRPECGLETDEFFFLLATGNAVVQIIPVEAVYAVGASSYRGHVVLRCRQMQDSRLSGHVEHARGRLFGAIRATNDRVALPGVDTRTVVTIAPGLPAVDYILRTGLNLRFSYICPIFWIEAGGLGMLDHSERLFVLGRS